MIRPPTVHRLNDAVEGITRLEVEYVGRNNIVPRGVVITSPELLGIVEADNLRRMNIDTILIPLSDPLTNPFGDVVLARCSLDGVEGLAQFFLNSPDTEIVDAEGEIVPPLRSVLETIITMSNLDGIAAPVHWASTASHEYLLLHTSVDSPLPPFSRDNVNVRNAVLGILDELHAVGILVGIVRHEEESYTIESSIEWVAHFFGTNRKQTKMELIVLSHLRFSFEVAELEAESNFVQSLFVTPIIKPQQSSIEVVTDPREEK